MYGNPSLLGNCAKGIFSLLFMMSGFQMWLNLRNLDPLSKQTYKPRQLIEQVGMCSVTSSSPNMFVFFLFSMFHHSSGCFVCNAMIAVTYQCGNGSFLTMNEPLKSRLNWRPVCFLYLKGKMLQGRLCGQMDQVHLLDFSLKIFCLEHSIYLRTP